MGRGDLPDADLPDWVRLVERTLVPARMDWGLIQREGPRWMALWDRSVRGRAGS